MINNIGFVGMEAFSTDDGTDMNGAADYCWPYRSAGLTQVGEDGAIRFAEINPCDAEDAMIAAIDKKTAGKRRAKRQRYRINRICRNSRRVNDN